jgi:hypothetical protein
MRGQHIGPKMGIALANAVALNSTLLYLDLEGTSIGPGTMRLTPYTMHHTPYTIHHTPYTIHHTLYTIHYTLYSYTIGPEGAFQMAVMIGANSTLKHLVLRNCGMGSASIVQSINSTFY